MGMSWQTLESTSMKDSLKLPRGATGVYITSTDPCYNASKVGGCHCNGNQRVCCCRMIPVDGVLISHDGFLCTAARCAAAALGSNYAQLARAPSLPGPQELRVGDVLTHVQGHSIADDGTFLFEGQNVRIDFRHLSSMAYDGESLQLRVWRDGAAHELSVQVRE